ncbi:MAG: hypothetical protein UR54_C0008G0002 [Candidatus Roizmanbacteria bacterium GW2011_GWA2_34_18]|uniref:Uncharacterized protein n=1 Tax=Candidatus Roizmanbacteria bacterium GW2011_GWA2_34_18 TaxID=1618477 RepID=A0A0G0BAJ1_9BACT|nr:MAG: hypothetical protein UR54_C0008G0002 [Candidatus Roizmanbacteria bacterium GW2011_GWA2_34_18]
MMESNHDYYYEHVEFLSEKEITDRFYSDGGTIQNLSREDRNIFIGESLEIDLVQAQLAIVASRWNAKMTTEALKNGLNIWDSFYKQFPNYQKDYVKKWVKKAIYSLCFGAGKDLRKKILHNLSSNASEIFHKNIYIVDVLKARNKFIQYIKKNKRIKTVRNKWLSTNELTIPQILALFAQAYEYELIEPIFELYKKNKNNKHGLEMICYEFDGLHLRVKREEDKEEWKRRIIEVVNIKAKNLGIPTKLEINGVCTLN